MSFIKSCKKKQKLVVDWEIIAVQSCQVGIPSKYPLAPPPSLYSSFAPTIEDGTCNQLTAPDDAWFLLKRLRIFLLNAFLPLSPLRRRCASISSASSIYMQSHDSPENRTFRATLITTLSERKHHLQFGLAFMVPSTIHEDRALLPVDTEQLLV